MTGLLFQWWAIIAATAGTLGMAVAHREPIRVRRVVTIAAAVLGPALPVVLVGWWLASLRRGGES